MIKLNNKKYGRHQMTTLNKVKNFSKFILEWANDNLREFPWRKTKNPYELLIAEIMLQRTKANQVKPVFEQFIIKYPNLNSLSKASTFEIEKELQSLGLKKRAKNLKILTDQIERDFLGNIPNTVEDLLKLHGVGKYTANAILCHAFGLNVATVDVNFARILVRVFSLRPNAPAQKDKMIWEFADGIATLTKNKMHILNLAILDLGSEVCFPKNPACDLCPLISICDYSENR